MAGCRIYRYGATIKYNFEKVIQYLGSSIQNHLLNIQGKRIPSKVVVLESDDWGTIRIPSKKAYDTLQGQGLRLDKNPYNRVDSLETSEDLSALFDVLTSIRDSQGNFPIVTANFIMANPDFDLIRKSSFSKYVYERFTETYKRAKSMESNWALIQQASQQKILRPQFHGREHVNVVRWLSLLQKGDSALIKAFNEGVFSIDLAISKGRRENLMASLDFSTSEERSFAYAQLLDGAKIFKDIFGYSSKSFIAPANVWDEGAEDILSKAGVEFLQGFRGHLVPAIELNGYKTLIHNLGDSSKFGQGYIIRNCYFEPATLPSYDWLGSCQKKISTAFFWGKPAIISLHRLNFIGSISQDNRKTNLRLLKELLIRIVKKWPDVQFLSSDQLGALLYKQKCVD